MRGMWSIYHPLRAFDYINEITPSIDNPVTVYSLMSYRKFSTFNTKEVNKLLSFSNVKGYDVFVKNPNNPAVLIKSKLIKFHY